MTMPIVPIRCCLLKTHNSFNGVGPFRAGSRAILLTLRIKVKDEVSPAPDGREAMSSHTA